MNTRIINTCSVNNIRDIHSAIIENVVDIYKKLLASNLVNIRIMSSVPRGHFRPYNSDIDFIALVSNEIDDLTKNDIDEARKTLEDRYEMYRKIDLEVLEIAKIGTFREFVFITDSLSLFGNDMYPKKEYQINRNELAELVTPNLYDLIKNYREGLENSENDESKKQYSRWIGKDILKALRWKIIIEKGIYDKNAKDICLSLETNYREDKVLFRKLLNAYLNPTIDRELLMNLLCEVELRAEKYNKNRITIAST